MRTKGRLSCSIIAFALACVLSVSAARAQLETPTTEDVIKTVMTFVFGPGLAADQMTFNGFMQNLIFPFLALFVVMYGILSEIKIFHATNVKLVLALIMAFVSGYGVLATMHGFLIANAWMGTVGFGLVMFLGIIFWAGSRISSGWFDVSGRRIFGGMAKREQQGKRLNDLRAQQAMYYNTWQKLVMAGRVAEANDARQQFEQAKKDADDIEKEMYDWLKDPQKMG